MTSPPWPKSEPTPMNSAPRAASRTKVLTLFLNISFTSRRDVAAHNNTASSALFPNRSQRPLQQPFPPERASGASSAARAGG